MGCPEREAKLTDWVMEELSPPEARELEQHVAHCAECRRSLDRLRRVRQALNSNLTDREMSAHLVFVGEGRRRLSAGFLASLWRTAALAAVAAAVFLAVFWGGSFHLRQRLVVTPAVQKTALSQSEIRAFVAQAMEEASARQRKEIEAAGEKVALSLRQEQMADLARLAQRLRYLESAQSAVWKQTQQQGQLVDLMARNSFGPRTPPTDKP